MYLEEIVNTTKQMGLLFCIVTIFAFLLSSIPASARAKYLYAYGIKTLDNRLIVRAVDPGSLNTARDILSISLPLGTLYVEALPSTNGEWLALMLDPYTQASLQLANLKTGEIRNIPIKLLLWDGSYIFGRRQLIEWSPDSRHLAFIGSQNDDRRAFIYTVQNKELMSVEAESASQYGLTWLSNGSQLAVLSDTCASSDDCTHRVDIFATTTRSLQTSINIAHFDGEPEIEEICQLQGSPHGRYLIFKQSCYPSALGSYKELYLSILGRKKSPN
jgi:WD40 repeat protein